MKFISCTDRTRYDRVASHPYVIMEGKYLSELKESLESGLIPVPELDVFVREGYGALVGRCPSECKTLEQLYQYNPDLSIVEKLKNALTGKKNESIFDYENYVKEGADLVIGPGCKVEGLQYDKAVYCRNYKEMIEKMNIQNETSRLSR